MSNDEEVIYELTKHEADVDSVIREIAKDVGKEVILHIETVHPEMFKAVRVRAAKLSIKTCIYNEIIEAVREKNLHIILRRLLRQKKYRKHVLSMYGD